MKAIRLLEYGGQLVFSDVPTPTIARDEILVKIRNTAVNHIDVGKASGTARQIFPIDLPCALNDSERRAILGGNAGRIFPRFHSTIRGM